MKKCLLVTKRLLILLFQLRWLLKLNFYLPLLLVSLLLFNSSLYAQQKMITGIVTDADSQPLPGVSVKVRGTNTGTNTGTGGNYSISAGKGQVLEFTYVGKTDQEITIGTDLVINVTLKEGNSSDLNEVIVTGYMTQKKAHLTGAISVVSAKDLNKNHGTTNVLEALQGVVPGMHITTDGSPTGHVDVQLRGLTSVNGSHPLIVIDGVPSYMNLRDINPNNIASLQVLKDAASASIYGAQGAAGVILIETKKGQAGKTRINYNGSFGVSDFANKVPMLNTQQYGRAMWQAAVNDGQDPNTYTQIYDYDWHKDDQGIPVLDKVTPIRYLNADSTMVSANTNWLDAISQLGIQNDHQITLSGGSEKMTSLLSLNFFENQGTQIYTGYKRFTGRFNSVFHVLNNHLTIGENLEISHLKINDQNAMHEALVEPPIIPVHTTDGGWGGSAVALGMDDYWNPVRDLTLNKDNGNNYNKLFGDVYASINFLKHFTFRSQLGLIYTEGDHRTIQFTFQEGGGKFNPTSSVDQWHWQETALDFTNTLDYKLNAGKHDLDFLAGMEANKYVTATTQASRQDLQFQNYDYAYLSTATGNVATSGGGDKFNFLSYFSKFNYAYNSKYLLSASLRYDGSSKFGKNNQFGLFPAVSAGWRLSDEDFLSHNKSISDLKLRVSWGQNGNLSNINSTATGTYFISDYNYTSYSIGGSETGSLPSGFRRTQTGNEDLKWETTTQTDVGIDFGFFKQKISGSLDFYHKFTDGMLFQPPYPGIIGEGGQQWVNAADMTNNGVELQIAYQSNPQKSFTYTIGGNISYNKNSIAHLPKSVQYSYGGSALKGDDIQGRPLHSYYGFVTDGIFKSQEEVDNSPDQPGKGLGRLRYKDLSGPEGKPDGKIDFDYDRTWIGSWDPTVEYGISFSANYKNFDFSMFWQGVAGNTVNDGWKSYSDFWNVWVQNGFNHPTRLLDAWSPANPNSDIPALSLINPNNELRTSTYFMESGAYLKMRNIQLGYTLPKRIASSIGMERLHIYVVGLNLINIKKSWGNDAFTGPDPENPNGFAYENPYVRPQTYKVGVDVSF